MKTLSKLLFTTAVATSMSGVAVGQDSEIEALKKSIEALNKKVEELEKKSATVKKAEPAMSIGTSDGNFEMNLRGRLYIDYSDISGMDAGTEFRTARMGIEGKAWKDVKYKFEADFADNDVDVKDAYMELSTGVGKVRVGQFKEFASLDEQTSSRHTAFMERASFTDAFGISRATGIAYGNGGDNWTFKTGVYKGSFSSEGEGQTTFAARATYGGEMEDGVWMIGASARIRDRGDSSLRYRQRPHQHRADRVINTGSLVGNKDNMFGAEAAATFGSFWVSSEFSHLTAKDSGAMGRDGTMWGGYVDAGFFLTGETRPLKLGKGAWDRPKVNNPVQEGGMGAWAIAARYDRIDLTSDGIYGGQMDSIILGVNWYLNRHSRVLFNYNHSEVEKMGGPLNTDGKADYDGFGVRFQVDW